MQFVVFLNSSKKSPSELCEMTDISKINVRNFIAFSRKVIEMG